jgi:hypothetical protein
MSILGDLQLMWGDNHGMDFAKTLVIETAHALLEEAGPGKGPWPELYSYGLSTEAYLASAPTSTDGLGKDGYPLYYSRKLLPDHPWALYASMIAAGRGDARDPRATRLHLVGHTALFLAATGDAEGARRAMARVADVESPPLRAVLAALEHEPPARIGGAFYDALEAAVARARGAQADTREASDAAARLRAIALDREIAVPLHLLEAFARLR